MSLGAAAQQMHSGSKSSSSGASAFPAELLLAAAAACALAFAFPFGDVFPFGARFSFGRLFGLAFGAVPAAAGPAARGPVPSARGRKEYSSYNRACSARTSSGMESWLPICVDRSCAKFSGASFLWNVGVIFRTHFAPDWLWSKAGGFFFARIGVKPP